MSLDKASIHNKEHSSLTSLPDAFDIDLSSYHEKHAGRLIIDPKCVSPCGQLTTALTHIREARIEFGDAVAAKLKLSADGTKVLWPQPADSPFDPQNWSSSRKALQLVIITLAATVPDFDSGIGRP
jgi:hypothetical protein